MGNHTNKDGFDNTDMAEDRTILANERTFAGWMRTSMACVAVALGIRALARDFEPGWLLKLAGSLLIVAAIILVWLAWRRSRHILDRLSTHTVKRMPRTPMGAIAIALVLSYLTFGAVLWVAL